jgi:uncharacterized protein (TIGR02099 family)
MFFCLVLLTLRYWILPDIGKYHADIVTAITQAAEQPIQINAIQANWDGLRPHLSMHGVSVYDRQARLVLVFPNIEGTISWQSILRGELNFHEIVIDQPALVMRRDTEGLLHIAGITLSGKQQETGFFDWLLRQRHLLIKQAFVYWQDDLHHQATHYFESVNLRLKNKPGDNRHQFGLRAKSSSPLFSQVDVRGDLIGDSLQTLSAWQGRMFVQLQDFDLEHWQEWLTLPADVALKQGQGSMRAWMDVEAGNLSRWVADVSLREAIVRFSQQLPLLNIHHLYGRSGWSKAEDALGVDEQWFVHNLNIALKDQQPFEPIAALWHTYDDRNHQPPKYKLQVEKFDLAILTELAANLPLDNTLHNFLSELSPQGMVKHANLAWQGDWAKTPAFQTQVVFNNLTVQSFDKYPAVKRASGIFDATETGGSLFLSSKKMELYGVPQLKEKLLFDTLVGRVDWVSAHDNETFQLKLNNIVYASNAGSGVLQGSYVFNENSPAQIDLTGHLSQANLPLLSQYIAWLSENEAARKISETILSGQLYDTKFRLQGELGRQSIDDKLSVHVETDMSNIAMRISDNWPIVSDIAGQISVQDNILAVSLFSAEMSGINLQELTLQTSDLYAEQPKINIKGSAQAEGSEVLGLLRKVDVSQHINEFLRRTELFGQGQLQLDTSLLLTAEGFSVSSLQGNYQFINNRINFDQYIPDFYQVNGSLVFTETGIALKGIRAQLLGGPIEISSSVSSTEGMHIAAKGRVDFDRFQSDTEEILEPARLSRLWTQFMRGSTDWQLGINIGHDQYNIAIESSLEGLELVFPAPFAKTAIEVIPLRLERLFTQPHDDHIRLYYGNVVNAEFQRRHEKIHFYHPIRGVIHFGGKSELPPDQNTQIKGSIPKLEWDQWRELFRRHAKVSALIDPGTRGLDNILTRSMQFDLEIGQLEFLSRNFNRAHLVVDRQDNAWKMQVSSREVDGEIDWDAAIPQKVTARLSQLMLPDEAPESVLLSPNLHAPGDWPALDIEADEVFMGDILLGQMKLSAIQKQNGWLVENLDIRHPDSRLLVDGLWENHQPPYRFLSRIQLQSSDIGKFFKRYGYPDRVARGEGAMAGELEWAGKPFSIDFPTLSGKLQLDAQYGQFTELKPGIGRLLGVFDLKSLPRRLTLNFYDIFGKGFSFDEVGGLILIKNGIASTDNLYIAGSSAELMLSGQWDLLNEMQTLNLKVYPSFGLVTPIAGLAAMVTSGTLQDPFNRVLFNEYTITGSWSDPVVMKVGEEENQTE